MTPLGERLARVETKLDAVLEHLETLAPLEKRVRVLERWRAYVLGAGAAVSAGIAWLLRK